jgi:hypothetical protein
VGWSVINQSVFDYIRAGVLEMEFLRSIDSPTRPRRARRNGKSERVSHSPDGESECWTVRCEEVGRRGGLFGCC